MKQKHLEIRMNQCLELAKASNCPRRKFGAMVVDPERNVVLMDAYNGGPRGGGRLCGGEVCDRIEGKVASGTAMEIGCHHSETNVICNAAAAGVAIKGMWLIVTGEPCLMCAKMIHHAGISRVVIISGVYPNNGIRYLIENGVEVFSHEGKIDLAGFEQIKKRLQERLNLRKENITPRIFTFTWDTE